jgi:hypothetical protein
MKIRNGFVSNSSSTSFVCIGVMIDMDVIGENKALFEKYDLEMDEGEYELMEKVCHKTGLQFIGGDGDFYVGRVIEFNDEDPQEPEEIEFDLKSAKYKSLKTFCEELGVEFNVKTYAGTVGS